MIPARVVLTILGFFGVFILYASLVSLSVAMVAMVGKSLPETKTNETAVACLNLLPYRNLSKGNELFVKGEFDWDIVTQSRVLGAFYYGYLLTQIPGGILAKKYGAKWIYGLGIFTAAILSLLIPMAARWNAWALGAVRVIQGLAGGIACPAMNTLIARWAPKSERSRISSFMTMGIQIGTFSAYVFSGMLCESSFLGGWPSVFYISGLLGCIWFIFWITFVYESPEKHPGITEKELNFIKLGQDAVHFDKQQIKVPWKSIWSSVPVWAVVITHFGLNWILYTYLTMMPTYFYNILHLDLKNNGLFSGLPSLMMAIFSVPACIAADSLRASGRLKITTIRKLFNSIAFYGLGFCLLAIVFFGCEQFLIIALFGLSFAFSGFLFSGFIVTHVDMSPQFAGILFGITNCIATLPGFLAPAFAGMILDHGQTLRSWRIIFITASFICLLTGTFYNIFASAELQPWNQKPQPEVKLKQPIETISCTLKDSEISYL